MRHLQPAAHLPQRPLAALPRSLNLSGQATALWLGSLGKSVEVLNDSPVPPAFRFLAEWHAIDSFDERLAEERFESAAHVAVVDEKTGESFSIEVRAADGTFSIGREMFPDFERYARLGVHIQSDQVRIATPPPEYVEAAPDPTPASLPSLAAVSAPAPALELASDDVLFRFGDRRWRVRGLS